MNRDALGPLPCYLLHLSVPSSLSTPLLSLLLTQRLKSESCPRAPTSLHPPLHLPTPSPPPSPHPPPWPRPNPFSGTAVRRRKGDKGRGIHARPVREDGELSVSQPAPPVTPTWAALRALSPTIQITQSIHRHRRTRPDIRVRMCASVRGIACVTYVCVCVGEEVAPGLI